MLDTRVQITANHGNVSFPITTLKVKRDNLVSLSEGLVSFEKVSAILHTKEKSVNANSKRSVCICKLYKNRWLSFD